jgi:hypothetical protein
VPKRLTLETPYQHLTQAAFLHAVSVLPAQAQNGFTPSELQEALSALVELGGDGIFDAAVALAELPQSAAVALTRAADMPPALRTMATRSVGTLPVLNGPKTSATDAFARGYCCALQSEADMSADLCAMGWSIPTPASGNIADIPAPVAAYIWGVLNASGSADEKGGHNQPRHGLALISDTCKTCVSTLSASSASGGRNAALLAR